VAEIGKQKLLYENQTQQAKNMEAEVESLKEELEKILNHKERLIEENLLIQARHDVDKKALVI
jgi:hypothetical protein